ncbi:hypothetical protein AURDEDRAFT_117015 [Auricularia subglabra TFB-10046 SS5]|uniref:Extracellular membrane protein CFEM domain-containing protein n=1 Tax=Auricularia subglabra (strain TFB-10046 / SS5) TaxID=717982 RepID=J0LGH9_AURST|nr:hypothetical protein AURDEDRAFT_117015 [Auricularia subglabra TFB-10046 SS5]
MRSLSLLLLSLLGAAAAQAPAQSAAAQCVVACGDTIDVGALCGVAADDDAGIANCMCTNPTVQAQLQTCGTQRCPDALNDALALLKDSCVTLSARETGPAAQCGTTCAKASAQTIKAECPDAAAGDPTALTKCLCTSQRVQAELSQCFAATCAADQDVGAFALGALDCGTVLVSALNGTSGAPASDAPLSMGTSTVTLSGPSSTTSSNSADATGGSPPPTTEEDGVNSAASVAPSLALGFIALAAAMVIV